MLLFDFLLAGLVIGGIYALISIGLNLQYGVARVLNLAYGEFLMLAGYGAFWGFTLIGAPPLVTLLVATPLAFGASWLLFRYVLHPLLGRSRDPGKREVDSILSTFGLLFVLQGVALVAWTGTDRVYSFLATPVNMLRHRHRRQPPVGAGRRPGCCRLPFSPSCATAVGRAMRAHRRQPAHRARWSASTSPATARCAFATGGALAAIAGMLLSTFVGINPTIGAAFTMKALIVIVMGGIGHVLGGLVAGLILGLAETMAALLLDPGLVTVINFAIFSDRAAVAPAGPVRRRDPGPGAASRPCGLPNDAAGALLLALLLLRARLCQRLLALPARQHPHLRRARDGLGLFLRLHALRFAGGLRLLRPRRLCGGHVGARLFLSPGARRRAGHCQRAVRLRRLRDAAPLGHVLRDLHLRLATLVREIVTWWEFNVAQKAGRHLFLSITTTHIYYQLLALCAFIIVLWLVRDSSRMGFALTTLGADETVARQIGINTVALKICYLCRELRSP